MSRITLALSKGRILEDTLPMLTSLGMGPDGDIDRLLRVPSVDPNLQFLIIRPADVPPYVEYGAADLGITGKDVLMEHGGEGLYEPLDLDIAGCRLSVAAVKGSAFDGPVADIISAQKRRIRVATKYPEITRRFFAERGEQVELIKLYGSMELAPLVGLADLIVDLVDTGRTLAANGLVETEVICDISSRIVVNKAAMKTRNAAIRKLLAQIAEAANLRAAA
ncbi:MAG: ATP phosphoribosyltransferase [Panacagrimonas sp.]